MPQKQKCAGSVQDVNYGQIWKEDVADKKNNVKKVRSKIRKKEEKKIPRFLQ